MNNYIYYIKYFLLFHFYYLTGSEMATAELIDFTDRPESVSLDAALPSTSRGNYNIIVMNRVNFCLTAILVE